MAFLVAALLVALDQVSKVWAEGALQARPGPLPLFPGVDLVYVRNPGAAFGMLRDFTVATPLGVIDGTVLLGLLSLAVAVWLVVELRRGGRPQPRGIALDLTTRSALTLILAGAVGNMIDRFRLGYVIDFVQVRFGWFAVPVFNVADAAISVGATLLILVAIFGPRRRRTARGDPPRMDPPSDDDPA